MLDNIVIFIRCSHACLLYVFLTGIALPPISEIELSVWCRNFDSNCVFGSRCTC